MTSIRKLLFLVLAVALTAFALPSLAAPAKIFGLTMDAVPSGNFIGGQVNTLSAKYTNLTPGGNSTINWVHLSVPNALWSTYPGSGTPTAPIIKFPQGGTVYSITTGSTSTEIVVNNIPGIGVNGGTWYFTIDVFVPSSPGCTDYQFSATAFTGNSGTQGQPFAFQATYNSFTSKTDIGTGTGCSLVFQKQPAGAQVNTTITSVGSDPTGAAVQVAAVDSNNNVATWFSGTITLNIKSVNGVAGANGANLSNGSATATSGVATFPALQIDKVASNYILTASATGQTSGDSSAFSIFANGQIGCVGGKTTSTNNYNSSNGKTDYTFDPDGSSAPASSGWGLRRGANYVTSDCVLVDYSFTQPTSANGLVGSLLYDRTVSPFQAASWKYIFTWPAIAVDSSNPTKGWTTFRPWVSWGIDSPNTASGSTDFVPALFCLDDPGDISLRTASQLQALRPKLPDDCDYSKTLDLANQTGPFCRAHIANPNVYYLNDANNPAKMCVSQQGYSSGPGNTVYPWTEIVDQADGFIKSP